MPCQIPKIVALTAGLLAAGPDEAEESGVSTAAVSSAVTRAIPLLEKAAAGSADQRQCFTCHNQAIPVLALTRAERFGFSVDRDHLQRQLDHTHAHLERGREDYLAGRGQGGKAIAAGYALWTLAVDGRKADETTTAVVEFLLEYQQDSDHWSHPGNRPPSSGSDFTTSYVALRALADFGGADQQPRIEARTRAVGNWLARAKTNDTEDRVFQLFALPYAGASAGVIQQATAELVTQQCTDGGWAQTDEMDSDAYATATVLVALVEAGGLATDHPAVEQGIAYLVRTQQPDGSWYVASRAQPFQKYFESGFPHGKDQFISAAASGWATLALVLSLPEDP